MSIGLVAAKSVNIKPAYRYMSELSKKIFCEVESQKSQSLQRLISTATPLRNAFTRATLIIRREIIDLQFFKKDGSQYFCSIGSGNYSLENMINEGYVSAFRVSYTTEKDEPRTTELRFFYNQLNDEFTLDYDRTDNEIASYDSLSDPTIIAENFIRKIMERCHCSTRLKSTFNLEQIEYFINFLEIIKNNFKLFFYNGGFKRLAQSGVVS